MKLEAQEEQSRQLSWQGREIQKHLQMNLEERKWVTR
jgi:hypothetical protein